MKEYIIELSDNENALSILVNAYSLHEIVRCKDCKYRSFYCTEATDGTTLYECHHPCANSVPCPGNWFCADGERKNKQLAYADKDTAYYADMPAT